jgi:hypothetical protein
VRTEKGRDAASESQEYTDFSPVVKRGVRPLVRTAVERIHGTITLDSQAGRGTRITITVPLSMAVTRGMIVESDPQLFGVPIDHVVETRVERTSPRTHRHPARWPEDVALCAWLATVLDGAVGR